MEALVGAGFEEAVMFETTRGVSEVSCPRTCMYLVYQE